LPKRPALERLTGKPVARPMAAFLRRLQSPLLRGVRMHGEIHDKFNNSIYIC
jgi:hypothetical protein